jgi:hypothetical protein
MSKFKFQINVKTMGTSNHLQFDTPVPYQVRGKLQQESSHVKDLWIPACAGMTFLEVSLRMSKVLPLR